MLANSLRDAGLDPPIEAAAVRSVLEQLGIDPRVRAEHLAPSQHLALARALLA